MLNSERTYVDLLFRASRKYASWDPEVLVKVGDWGRITRGKRGIAFWRKNGTFVKERNSFLDGKAEYNIPDPIEYDGGGTSDGETWIVSQNAAQVDVSTSVGIILEITPAIMHCNIKGALKFSSRRGAILVMENDSISAIDPPGVFRRLLEDSSMHGFVVISEVRRCSSYVRLLTAEKRGTIALGLSVEPPVSGVLSATAKAKWIRNFSSGNFRARVSKTGNRNFFPLFRLVGLTDDPPAMGIGKTNERTHYSISSVPK
ncbi:hypothetical protein C8R44DRAFT_607315 [Mycena epipterygia]|nr:hypothetical protein C8R44DRAFT_607315 [Mycena epipterygia]